MIKVINEFPFFSPQSPCMISADSSSSLGSGSGQASVVGPQKPRPPHKSYNDGLLAAGLSACGLPIKQPRGDGCC